MVRNAMPSIPGFKNKYKPTTKEHKPDVISWSVGALLGRNVHNAKSPPAPISDDCEGRNAIMQQPFRWIIFFHDFIEHYRAHFWKTRKEKLERAENWIFSSRSTKSKWPAEWNRLNRNDNKTNCCIKKFRVKKVRMPWISPSNEPTAPRGWKTSLFKPISAWKFCSRHHGVLRPEIPQFLFGKYAESYLLVLGELRFVPAWIFCWEFGKLRFWNLLFSRMVTLGKKPISPSHPWRTCINKAQFGLTALVPPEAWCQLQIICVSWVALLPNEFCSAHSIAR